eukprot:459835_1
MAAKLEELKTINVEHNELEHKSNESKDTQLKGIDDNEIKHDTLHSFHSTTSDNHSIKSISINNNKYNAVIDVDLLVQKQKTDEDNFKPTTIVKCAVEMTELKDENGKFIQKVLDSSPLPEHNQHAPSLYKQVTVMVATNKWLKLITNSFFWIRIFLFILSLFLAFLSASYCIAQLLEAKLDLITNCPEQRNREEIWRHSYKSSLKYENNHKLNEESQYGFTDESCWTTNKVEINTKALWYSNRYTFEWKKNINAQFLFFGLVALYCAFINVFIMITIIRDVIHIAQNIYHTKSKLYTNYEQDRLESNIPKSIKPQQKEQNVGDVSFFTKCMGHGLKLKTIYDTYLDGDTTGWIIMKFISEISEITLQSVTLLLYNGYHILDPSNSKNTYLAHKPEFIDLFACIITFNCFGSGILWICYLLK